MINNFYKGPIVNILGYAVHKVCFNSSTLPLLQEISHRKYVNEWMWQCSRNMHQAGWIWPMGPCLPTPVWVLVINFNAIFLECSIWVCISSISTLIFPMKLNSLFVLEVLVCCILFNTVIFPMFMLSQSGGGGQFFRIIWTSEIFWSLSPDRTTSLLLEILDLFH